MEDQEYLLRKYAVEFDACAELMQFAIDHRPTEPEAKPVAHLVLWTAARSHRTYRVGIKLCKLGYGQQATMLNRTLFEDMVVAHWASLNPGEAATRIAEYDELAAAVQSETFEKHGIPVGDGTPALSKERRRTLEQKYGKTPRSWTGKSVPMMVSEIARLWATEYDRRLLVQMHDFAYRTSNILLHHSSQSLSQGIRYSDEMVVFEVGPSERLIESALGVAFWVYGQTLSLVLDDQSFKALTELSQKHSRLYQATHRDHGASS